MHRQMKKELKFVGKAAFITLLILLFSLTIFPLHIFILILPAALTIAIIYTLYKI